MMDVSLRWPYATFAQAENEGVIAGFKDDHRWLSNFVGKVSAYGLAFGSVEAAFVASKLTPPSTATFEDGRKAVEALASGLKKPELLKADAPRGPTWLALETIAGLEPGLAKRVGRQLPLRSDWEKEGPDGLLVKEWTLLTLNRRKYAGNPELAGKLLATGGALILEANAWGDRTWGVIETKTGLEGFNAMGSIAVAVREEMGGRGLPEGVPAKAPRYTGKGLAAAPVAAARKTKAQDER
jgi:NADAR domain